MKTADKMKKKILLSHAIRVVSKLDVDNLTAVGRKNDSSYFGIIKRIFIDSTNRAVSTEEHCWQIAHG